MMVIVADQYCEPPEKSNSKHRCLHLVPDKFIFGATQCYPLSNCNLANSINHHTNNT